MSIPKYKIFTLNDLVLESMIGYKPRYHACYQYMIHTLIQKNINFRNQSTLNWVPLNMKVLESIFEVDKSTVNNIIKTLTNNNILHRVGTPIPGVHSYSYVFNQEQNHNYSFNGNIDNIYFIKRIKQFEKTRQKQRVKPIKNYNQIFNATKKVVCDFKKMDTFVNMIRNENVKAQFQYAVDKLKKRDYYLVKDKNGRIHTNFTNLSKDLLYYTDTGYFDDCANSQPLLLSQFVISYIQKYESTSSNEVVVNESNDTYIYNSDFSEKNDENQNPDFENNIYNNIVSYGLNPSGNYKTDNGLQIWNITQNLPQDVLDFQENCKTGKFWDDILYHFKSESRETVKTKTFASVLYGEAYYESKYKDYFKLKYPNVLRIVEEDKQRNGYKHISNVMQKMESKLWIETICKKLHNRGIFNFYPVHDSINFFGEMTEEKKQIAEKIIKMSYKKMFGIECTLHSGEFKNHLNSDYTYSFTNALGINFTYEKDDEYVTLTDQNTVTYLTGSKKKKESKLDRIRVKKTVLGSVLKNLVENCNNVNAIDAIGYHTFGELINCQINDFEEEYMKYFCTQLHNNAININSNSKKFQPLKK